MNKGQLEKIVKSFSDSVRLSKHEYRTDDRGSNPASVILSKSKSQSNAKEIEFQKFNDDCLLAAALVSKRGQNINEVIPSLNIFKSRKEYFRNDSELAKAMTTTGSGQGAEWIPTNFSNQIIELYQQELKVASMFQRITMTSKTFELPAQRAFSVARLKTEATDPTDSYVGTGKATLTAKGLIVDLPFSYELEEDSAIALIELLRSDIVNALYRAEETATINGDTTGSHQDSDVTSAEDARKAWKGLRKLALSGAKKDLSTFTYETIISLKQSMGRFASNPADLVWIFGNLVEGKLLTLKDSSGNPIVSTYNAFGPDATNKNGVIRTLLGAECINSEFIREDLNASGVYDGVTDDYSIIILANKRAFLYGDRRDLLVEQDMDIRNQTKWLVASKRMDFVDRWDAANNALCAVGYKIS